jgi:hypothetical protein
MADDIVDAGNAFDLLCVVQWLEAVMRDALAGGTGVMMTRIGPADLAPESPDGRSAL